MKTVVKAVTLLKRFSSQKTEWGLSELARATGIDKVIVYRLLGTLAREEFVSKDPKSRSYRLGPAVMELANAHAGRVEPLAVARPHLNALRKETGETVHFMVRRDLKATITMVLESPHELRVAGRIGDAVPLYCTCSGRCFIAFGDAALRRDALRVPLGPWTRYTITDRAVLEAEIRRVRANGFAIDDRQILEHARGAAAPIFDADGEVLSCIVVIGPTMRVTRAKVRMIAKSVRETARRVSRELGFTAAGFPAQHSNAR